MEYRAHVLQIAERFLAEDAYFLLFPRLLCDHPLGQIVHALARSYHGRYATGGLGKALAHVVVVVVERWVAKKMTVASVQAFKEFSQPITFSCRQSEKVSGCGPPIKRGLFKNSVGQVESHWLVDGCRAASQ